MSEENNEKSALVPRLRFPEFREAEEWESKPLKVMGSFFRGLTYSADEVSEQGLLVLRSSNIQDGTLVLDKDLVFVDKTCPGDIQLRSGDIAICMSNGSKALVGKSAEFRGNYDNDLTVGAFCSIFRPSVEFAKLIFQTPKYTKFVSVAIGGGNINNLKNSDLEEFDHPVPKLQPEQQKIADCLSSLDELITAETQKLDAIKTHKKGLMQQLFPREGETVPRLRFPEFQEAGEWEPKTIGDACESFSGGTPSTTNKSFYGGEIPFIRSAEIDKDETELFLSNEGLENSAAKMVKAGDILVALYGANSGDVALSKLNGAINQAILCLRHETNNKFVYQYLAHKKEWIIATFIQGGQGNLSGEIIKAIGLFFPKPKEQQRIADCLSSLDDLITAQSRKIDALKTHKKGLMQQLFPVVDEVPA